MMTNDLTGEEEERDRENELGIDNMYWCVFSWPDMCTRNLETKQIFMYLRLHITSLYTLYVARTSLNRVDDVRKVDFYAPRIFAVHASNVSRDVAMRNIMTTGIARYFSRTRVIAPW